jgi:hypothetical protein
MANTNYMVHITQRKFQELVGQNTGSICESKQRMIREHSPQSHCPRVQYGFMAETAQTCVAMHNLDLLAYDNIPEDWEEGEYGGKAGGAVHDQERDMVDFEAVCEVTDAGSSFVGVRDDDDFMAAVDELGGQLVDVALDAARLREEEVADHSNVVWHLEDWGLGVGDWGLGIASLSPSWPAQNVLFRVVVSWWLRHHMRSSHPD